MFVGWPSIHLRVNNQTGQKQIWPSGQGLKKSSLSFLKRNEPKTTQIFSEKIRVREIAAV